MAMLPEDAEFALLGQRFTVRLPPDRVDDLIARLPALGCHGEILIGSRTRRGRKTPGDPAAERLATELKSALDPRGVLR